MSAAASFTVAQIADRWNCDRRTVQSAIRRGALRAFPLRPGARRPTWRIPADAVAEFEAGLPAAPKPASRRAKARDAVEYF